MSNTRIKLSYLSQGGASSGEAITWNGSTWSPSGVVTSVGITAPAAGISVAGSPITSSGNITLSLANDLAAVEGLTGTGIAVRTSTDTWTTRAIGTSNTNNTAVLVTVVNGSGVSGPPVVSVAPPDNFAFKNSVRVATTTNITLSGLQTIDNVSVSAGDRVLVWQQTDAKQNGIYTASSSTWSRATDADSGDKLENGVVLKVKEGTNHSNKWFVLDTHRPITLGTTNLTFRPAAFNSIYSGSGTVAYNVEATLSNFIKIKYVDTTDGLFIDDSSSSATLKGKGTSSFGRLIVNNNSVTADVEGTTRTLSITSSRVLLGGRLDINAHLRLVPIVDSVSSSTVHNYNPTNFADRSSIHILPDGTNVTITGLQAPSTEKLVLIVNTSDTYNVTLSDENTSSSANNRFSLGSSLVLEAGESILLHYINNRWRRVSKDLAGGSGGGIYGGSGTISGVTNASLANGTSTLNFKLSDGTTAIGITDDGLTIRHTNAAARIDLNGEGVIVRFRSDPPFSGNGIAVQLTANENQTHGDVVFINSSSKAQIASAASYSSSKVVGICNQGATANNSATYILQGVVKGYGWNFTAGATLYLSTSGTSSNTITTTPPSSSGSCVVPIGYAISSDVIYFNPSMTIVENA